MEVIVILAHGYLLNEKPHMKKDFEEIAHTADLQIRVYGSTQKELFSNAVVGMFQAIKPRSKLCKQMGERLVCGSLPRIRDLEIESPDQEALLVDYLSEALYLSDVNDEAYLKADVHELSDTYIKVTLYGIPVYGFNLEIKAVTYHGLSIANKSDIWQADIVFDI